MFIVISPTLARSRWISSSRSSAGRLFSALCPPARNCSRHWASVAAVTPSSRATPSSASPRSRRRIVSVFRRAENRPGSRPPSSPRDAGALVSPFRPRLRLLMPTSVRACSTVTWTSVARERGQQERPPAASGRDAPVRGPRHRDVIAHYRTLEPAGTAAFHGFLARSRAGPEPQHAPFRLPVDAGGVAG